MRLLLGPGRWDGGKEGEGDFTKGAGLNDEQIDDVVRSSSDCIERDVRLTIRKLPAQTAWIEQTSVKLDDIWYWTGAVAERDAGEQGV